MVRLGAWLVCCLAVAVLCRNRPDRAALIALTVWVLVPGVAADLFVAGLPDRFAYHPASFLVVLSVWMAVTSQPLRSGAVAASWTGLLLPGLAVCVAAFLVTSAGNDVVATTVVVDQMLVPLLMFFLLLVGLQGSGDHDEARAGRILAAQRWVVLLAVGQCVLAVVQFVSGSVVFYPGSFATNFWFRPDTWTRWMGTTDHPLTLAFLIGVALPLTAVFRPPARVAAVVLLAAGTLITQSRTGLVVVGLGLVYLILRSRVSIPGRVALFGLAAGAVALALSSPLADGVQGRLIDDTGSSEARSDAWRWFFEHAGDYLAVGDGITSSFRVSAEAGLQTSFESSIVMYAIGLGLVPTLIWFGLQAGLVGRSVLRNPAGPVTMAAIVVTIVPHTYSALVVTGLPGPLSWTVLALCAVTASRPRGPHGRTRPRAAASAG